MTKLCSRLFLLFSLFFTILMLSSPSLAEEYDPPLPEDIPIIRDISVTKHPDDPNKSTEIRKESLPFSITITFERLGRHTFSSQSSMVIEPRAVTQSGSLANAPRANTIVYLNEEKTKFSFRFDGLSFDGTNDGYFSAYLTDPGYFHYGFILKIPNAISSYDETSNNTVNDESDFTEKGTTSNSTNTDNTTSKKEEKTPAPLTPQLLVSNYTYPTTIPKNKPFVVSIEIKNMSEILPIENITLQITPLAKEAGISSSQSLLHLYSSTDTFFIPKIEPKKTQTVEISLLASENISVAQLDLTLSFEYYEPGTPLTLRKKENAISLFLQLEKRTEIRLEKVVLPETIMAGVSFPIQFRIANPGNHTLSHLDFAILDKDNKELSRTYLGSLASGKVLEKPEITLYFESEGLVPLQFLLYYEDSYGVQKSVNATNTLEVTEYIPEESASTKQTTIQLSPTNKTDSPVGRSGGNEYLVLSALLLLATTGVFFFLLKRKETRLEMPKASLQKIKSKES